MGLLDIFKKGKEETTIHQTSRILNIECRCGHDRAFNKKDYAQCTKCGIRKHHSLRNL